MIYLKSSNKLKKLILASSFITLPGLGFANEIYEDQTNHDYQYLKGLLDIEGEKASDESFSIYKDTAKSKQGSEALMGTWILSYNDGSSHTDKMVIDNTFESDGEVSAIGKYYPDQTNEGVLILCLDYDTASYLCLAEKNDQDYVAFDIKIAGNSITSGYFGTGSSSENATDSLLSFQYPLIINGDSGQPSPPDTGQQPAPETGQPTPPEVGQQGSEAIYNDINNELDIPAVDYKGAKYRVILKNQGDFVFTVKEVLPLVAPQ